MGHLMDICPTAFLMAEGSSEDHLEMEFVRCLVCQAGLVMTGNKPAAVFGFLPRDKKCIECDRLLIRKLVAIYARNSFDAGIRIAALGWRDKRLMLLVWRPALIARLISKPSIANFLKRTDYPLSATALMSAFVRKLRSYYIKEDSFPHEIGIVLGYPLEDVEGFLSDGGRGARTFGRWKVYGNVQAARKRFEELNCLEREVKRLFSEGTPLREILRLGMA